MIDRFLATLRQSGSVLRPDVVRALWDAGILRPDSPQATARALPHLAARGPHLGVAFLMHAYGRGGSAVVEPARTLTWKQLNERAVRVGRGFRRRGVQPGERVGVLVGMRHELIECLGAAQKAGATVLVGDRRSPADRIQAAFASHPPRVIVYDTADAPAVEALAASLDPRPSLIAVGAGGFVSGSGAYEEVVAGADRQEFRPRPLPATPGILVQTGSAWVERTIPRVLGAGAGLLKAVPLRRTDAVLVATEPQHPLAVDVLLLALLLGCTILMPGRDPRAVLTFLQDEAAPVAVLDPDVLEAIVELPPDELRDFNRSRLQIAIVLGAPLDPMLRRRASNVLGPVVHSVYGTSEAGWVAITRPQDYDRKPSSLGRPIPGVSLEVRDSSGKRLPFGVAGEIVVGSELATADSGMHPSGDRGWIDDEGYLYLASDR